MITSKHLFQMQNPQGTSTLPCGLPPLQVLQEIWGSCWPRDPGSDFTLSGVVRTKGDKATAAGHQGHGAQD